MKCSGQLAPRVGAEDNLLEIEAVVDRDDHRHDAYPVEKRQPAEVVTVEKGMALTTPPRAARMGQGSKILLVLLPPALGRALERAIDDRAAGPILLTSRGRRRGRARRKLPRSCNQHPPPVVVSSRGADEPHGRARSR